MNKLSRRSLLLGATAAVGAGTLLVSVPVLRRLRSGRRTARPLGDQAWLRIDSGGTITAYANIAEMGQGAVTGLLQALADELDADWKDIRFELGPVDDAYYGQFGYYTAGSNSIRKRLPLYRELGARARAMLVTAAARQWDVPSAECSTSAGSVTHTPTGRTARYTELASAAARLPVPEQVVLKSPHQWTLISKSVPRLDTVAKVDGSARFGIDVEVPGMLIAAIAHCPVQGGKLGRVEEQLALSVPGVRMVVRLENAVAVLADGYWQANRGLAALRPEWEPGAAARESSTDFAARMDEELRRLTDAPPSLVAPPEGGSTVTATYSVPMLAQAPLEPMNATARVESGRVEVWAPTQFADACRSAIASALGVSAEDVTIHRPLIGGGFGRRLVHDFAVEAALIARSAGAPVKVIWSREEDFIRTTLRPAATMRMQATLDAQGSPAGLRVDSVTLGYTRQGVTFDPAPYRLGHVIANHGSASANVTVGAWRSVDASFDIFFLESLIDECAAAAGKDPLEYRLSLLDPGSRTRRVLIELQRMCGYSASADASRPIGFACFAGLDSHMATAIELARTSSGGEVRIERIFCAVDCGLAVNPQQIRAQIEGGVIFALSATLGERITFSEGRVQQRSFAEYPVLPITKAPEIRIEILDDPTLDPGGVGELAGPTVAPALANALSRLGHGRLRSLPMVAGS